MKTKKKAISLIVLVITIIILAILAVTLIVTLTNSGIINTSEYAVKTYDLSQVRDMVNLAWTEALMDDNIISDDQYQNYVQSYLTNAGVDTTKYDIEVSAGGASVALPYAGITITVDTEDFTFIPVDGVEVTEKRMKNLQIGDKVVYGDYVYCYRREKRGIPRVTSNMDSWVASDIKGWGVSVINESMSKTELGEMCGTILGMPVLSMRYAFSKFITKRVFH